MVMVKKDWAKIAEGKTHKPGENMRKRYLFYARNKVGKSTLGASGGKTLVIDPEGGTEELNDNSTVWPVYDWNDLTEVFQYLKAEGHKHYDWANLDGLTRMNNMALRFVMKQAEERDLERIPGMVDRRDYGKSGELMKGMLFNFHNLPINLAFTAQERMEVPGEFDSVDEDEEQAEARYVPDLPKGVRSSVNSIVSGIGRIYTVRIEDPKNAEKTITQRRLFIGNHDAYDTGFRSKHVLPDHLKNPTIPRLNHLIQHGHLRKVTK